MNARQLQGYLAEKVAAAAAAGEIAPELFSFIQGDSPEQIDASIDRAKQKTQSILAGIRSAQARPSDADQARFQVDVQSGFGDSDRQLAERVAAMDMQEYARNRQSLGVYRDTMSFLGGS